MTFCAVSLTCAVVGFEASEDNALLAGAILSLFTNEYPKSCFFAK